MEKILSSFVILLHFSCFAQDSIKTTFLSLEIDPAPFILNGYSLSIKFSPETFPKMAVMASVYSAEFPNAMMSKENQENGWTDLKIETSYAVFTEFFLKTNRCGFYFGPSVFLYNKSVGQSNTGERAGFSTLYPNLRVGYVWYPFKNIDLYLNPWLNLGSEINIDENNTLNGISFEPNKFNYIVAVHLGYSFDMK